MTQLEECLSAAMGVHQEDLLIYLPYIVQDQWELGSDPGIIISMIERHFTGPDHGGHSESHGPSSPPPRGLQDLRVLDLGCGKGAVSVLLAKRYGCTCLGIDGMPEFIYDARKKAAEHGVTHLCTFETGDLRERVKDLSGFDIVILGGVGPVFGEYRTTLSAVSRCLNGQGIIILDDGYLPDGEDTPHPQYITRNELHREIELAGLSPVDEVIHGKEDVVTRCHREFALRKERCQELMGRSQDQSLYWSYLNRQEAEIDLLNRGLIRSTMMLTMKNGNVT